MNRKAESTGEIAYYKVHFERTVIVISRIDTINLLDSPQSTSIFTAVAIALDLSVGCKQC